MSMSRHRAVVRVGHGPQRADHDHDHGEYAEGGYCHRPREPRDLAHGLRTPIGAFSDHRGWFMQL